MQRPTVVVLVEDEFLVRMLMADVLSDAGFRVLEASDAQEALALLEARPDVQVLVTDVDMPGPLDGLALVRIVGRSWPGVGILVVSGRIDPSPGDLPAGACFLAKSCPPSTLIETVHKLSGREEPRDGGGDAAEVLQGAPILPEGVPLGPSTSKARPWLSPCPSRTSPRLSSTGGYSFE